MAKFIEYLSEANRIIRACDHMIYVSYPLIKDKKLLIKILIELKKGLAYCINAILQYEYIYKRIKLYQDAKDNMQTFVNKSSKRYNITNQEIKSILEIFDVVEMHKKSPITFTRDEKIVILTDNMAKHIITLEKTKEFLALSKNILQKTNFKIKEI